MMTGPLGRENVPANLDAYGNEIAAVQTGPGAVLPVRMRQEGDVPTAALDRELTRIGYTLTEVQKDVAGEELPRERQREYQEVAGQLLEDRLRELFVSRPYLEAGSDDARYRMARSVVSRTREQARDQLDLPLTRAADQPWRWRISDGGPTVQDVAEEARITRLRGRWERGDPSLTTQQKVEARRYRPTREYDIWAQMREKESGFTRDLVREPTRTRSGRNFAEPVGTR